VAGGYAVWSVLAGRRPVPLVGRIAFAAVAVVFFAAGMIYPAFAPFSRGVYEANAADPLTLDGRSTMVRAAPGEYEAIQCFADFVGSASAVGRVEAPCNCGYAPQIGRVSGLTGVPTVLGWANHEGQWRGATYPDVTEARYENGRFRDRLTDVRALYTTRDWDEAWATLERYGIDYVVVGAAERQMISELAGGDPGLRQDYEQGLAKFGQTFTPVCQNEVMAIYRVKPN